MKTIVRLIFVILIFFEIANYIRVLHFTVDFTWFGLLISSILIFAGLEIGNYILKSRLHTALPASVWPLACLAVAIDAAGDMLHLYSRFLWYDQFGHFLGGAIAVIVLATIYRAVASRHGWQHPYHLTFVFALGMATLFGVLYEIEEYAEDYFNLTNRLGNGQDTANDLLMNLSGSLIVIALAASQRYVKRTSIR